jgi:hypothetical protein
MTVNFDINYDKFEAQSVVNHEAQTIEVQIGREDTYKKGNDATS